jgi:hypothetical protein
MRNVNRYIGASIETNYKLTNMTKCFEGNTFDEKYLVIPEESLMRISTPMYNNIQQKIMKINEKHQEQD